MKYIKLADYNASDIILGCMRIRDKTSKEIQELVETAISCGINFFDHADIYSGGICEENFGNAINLKSAEREKMIIQTKCGISKGYFDFSKEHIIEAATGSLKRLKTDYIDILLLHRPDPLVEPQEVAEAFRYLKEKGYVKHFGVSNHTPYQIQLLEKYTDEKLIVNQLQLSIVHSKLIDSSICLNMNNEQSVNRDSGVLDFCRLNDITIQAWSPFQKGFFGGVFIDDKEYSKLNTLLADLAKQYNVSKEAIAVSWITRHPADMQVVLGTTNPERVKKCCDGSEIRLTRKEWSDLYKAAGNIIP
ncbi:MAG: aldo/keto reductase [Clostridia bacterium]|nr:aldo/keto reductase [Clostridia bacterium]